MNDGAKAEKLRRELEACAMDAPSVHVADRERMLADRVKAAETIARLDAERLARKSDQRRWDTFRADAQRRQQAQAVKQAVLRQKYN